MSQPKKHREKAIKDITETNQLEAIIKRCQICRIGMIDGNRPYVLAFNFGYHNKTIYLHCAKEGKKIDVLQKNNQVCIEFDTDHELFARHEHVACSWRWKYRGVLAWGKAVFVDDNDEKLHALKIFMQNYSDRDFKFSKPAVDNIQIIKIKIDEWTGRSFEY